MVLRAGVISDDFNNAIKAMKLVLLSLAILLGTMVPRSSAQGLDARSTGVELFNGNWTYRSFVSDPDPGTRPDDLLFGSGTLKLAVTGNVLTGTLGGPGWQLNLTGQAITQSPLSVRFQGKGMIGGEEWIYDYLGYLVPTWPDGVDQVPAIVGSIIRTVPHSGGQARAGVVAQWIAVRQPASPAGEINALAPMAAPAFMQGPARRLEALVDSDRLRRAYLDADVEQRTNPLPPAAPPKIIPPAPPGARPPGASPRPVRPLDAAPGDSRFRRETPPFPRFAPGAAGALKPSLNPTHVKRDQDGRLRVELIVDYNQSSLKIGNDEVRLRTYNHRSGGTTELSGPELVGPVIRAKAGETLSILLRNNLPPEQANMTNGVNGHHEWNTTNLHFHGLHVAPQGTPDAESDNVLLSVRPGETQQYEVRIPADHVAGTFWYHAHRHGSTAAQVSSGMAGALIIERDDAVHNLDSIPEVAAAAQEVMVLQAIPYLKQGNAIRGTIEPTSDADIGEMFDPTRWKASMRYITVNGLKIPTIVIAPGELRRLRLIQSGQREPMRLKIERNPEVAGAGDNVLPMYEIAVDGLPTGRLAQWQQLELHPGYRTDVLLRPSPETRGEFFLVDANAAAGTGADGSPEPVRHVARIVIAGTPMDMPLPNAADLAGQDLDPPSGNLSPDPQYAFYGLDLNAEPITFNISDAPVEVGQAATSKPFRPDAIRPLVLGRTEKWIVGSRNGARITHPFHIHVNPFYITGARDAGGRDVLAEKFGGPVWRDTLAMEEGFTYTLISEYKDFTGTFVNHCHILDHEDRGMMEKVQIYDPNQPAAPPPPAGFALMAPFPQGAAAADSPPGKLPPLLKEFEGSPLLAVVIRSVTCKACLEQVDALEKAVRSPGWPRNLKVVVLAPDSPEEVAAYNNKSALKGCRFLADPSDSLLNAIDPLAVKDDRRHAVFFRQGDGKVLAKSATAEPLPVEALQAQFPAMQAGAAPQVGAISIDVHGTSGIADDYVTWSPAPCTLRLENPPPQDLTLVLTNDPLKPAAAGRPRPSDGDVVFDQTLVAGNTAVQPQLVLTIPAGQRSADFHIAGKFGRPSSRDKDCVIEIHQGAVDGPLLGTHALMVRVRKNVTDLEDHEIEELVRGFEELHVGGINSAFEKHVKFHALAGGRDFLPWKDQAHIGPAFIPWHRAFLLSLERELQKTRPGIAFPYWRMDRKAAPAADQKEILFTRKFMGENAIIRPTGANRQPIAPVLFDSGHPLSGWSLQLEGDNGQPLGALWRSARNRDQVPAFGANPPFSPPEDTHMVHESYVEHWMGVEPTPHDFGHGWVGPWMERCSYSPGDPVFWLFHCDFDRLWAKWQFKKNRFRTDGQSADHYWPTGAFTTSRTLVNPRTGDPVPKGHYLEDTLWPWDGSVGNEEESALERRPSPNEIGPFPVAPIAGLWPRQAASPKVGDMIDYLGIDPQRDPMGFCYDDVPYGVSAETGPTPRGLSPRFADREKAMNEMILTPGFSPAMKLPGARLLAAGPLGNRESEFITAALSGPDGDEVEKTELLRALEANRSPAAKSILITTLQSPVQAGSLRATAAGILGNRLHLSQSQADAKEVEAALATGARDNNLDVKLASLEPLAQMGDKEAIQQLNQLVIQAAAKPPGEELLKILHSAASAPVDPSTRPILERSASVPDEAVAVAAIHALEGDAPSAQARFAIVKDPGKPANVRRAALEGLIHHPDTAQVALALLEDKAQPAALRVQAADVLRAHLRGRNDALTRPVPAEILTLLQNLAADPSDATLQRAASDNLKILVPTAR